MLRRFSRFTSLSPLALVLYALALHAQDASLVLRTSVGYNTQKATLPLTDEQRKQADDLGRQAREAGQAGKYGEAIRYYYQGLALMRNVAWTPAVELAAGLQGHLDHVLVEPGKPVAITLKPLYTPTRPIETKVTAAAFLKSGATEKSIGPAVTVDPAALPFTTKVSLPDTPAGNYTLEVRLAVDGEAPLPAARTALYKSMPLHIEALADSVQRLRDRLSKLGKNKSPALPSAEYTLELYDRIDHGEANPAAFKLPDEIAAANRILDALEAGRDPFAGKHGDFRKAYRSKVDNSLQPYRVLVPATYDGTKPAPLLVALHGMGGDENTMFDGYKETLKPEAEREGFITVCPKGRDSASMYRGSAEQDVLDVIAEVRRDYRIDPNRIYLMGHSMGGYGTWSLAMAHPDLFAAIGPISGGGDPNGMSKIRQIPEYVVHGDNDRTVNVSMSRMMVEAGKKLGAPITYVEIPGGSHVDVAAPQFGRMLDFFAKQEKHAVVSARP